MFSGLATWWRRICRPRESAGPPITASRPLEHAVSAQVLEPELDSDAIRALKFQTFLAEDRVRRRRSAVGYAS